MKFTRSQKDFMQNEPLKYAKSLDKAELKKVIAELDHRYHELNKPAISDEAYDIIHDVFFQGKRKTKKDVGGTRSVDIKLEVPMNSLEKFRVISESRQSSFLSASGFVISDKEDGISLCITYDGGVPVLVTTRGKEGLTGKDVSRFIPVLNIPKKIPYTGRFIVRAEFTIEKDVFQKFFAGEAVTGRNTAGGFLNRVTPDKSVKKFKVICYEVLKGKSAGGPLWDQLQLLQRYKFDVVPHKFVKKVTVDELIKYHDERKRDSDRDIDGIVVFQNKTYKITPGYPDYAYAFKINSLAASVLVKVKEIVWEETRLGRLHPTIKIEPTVIGGVTVSSFTGHSNFYIEHGYKQELKKNPPYEPRPINVGATIRAVRSGDVIPFIMEVVKGAKTPSKPDGAYTRNGVQLYVSHDDKSDTRRIKELTYFFTSLEVDGMKDGTIKILVAAGYDTVKKIMRIKLAEAQTLPGFAAKSGKTLYDNLQDAKQRFTFLNIARASAAFGQNIGEKRLQSVVDHYPDFLELASHEDVTAAQLSHKLIQVKGLKKLAVQIAENFKRFTKFCKRNGISLVAEKKKEVSGSSMNGVSVLFTSVRDKEAQDWIVANGGKIASTVKQATLVIIKDANASNNKTAEAQSKGIAIQTLADFRKKHGI